MLWQEQQAQETPLDPYTAGCGLDGEDRFVVERSKTMLDGDIRAILPEPPRVNCRRKAKRVAISRKEVAALARRSRYAPDRSGDQPVEHLDTFTDILQVDVFADELEDTKGLPISESPLREDDGAAQHGSSLSLSLPCSGAGNSAGFAVNDPVSS